MTPDIIISHARPEDSVHVADMSNALHVELDYDNPPHTTESIHEMMFGPKALIKSLIAWDRLALSDRRSITRIIQKSGYG
jgi:hypothetical protein